MFTIMSDLFNIPRNDESGLIFMPEGYNTNINTNINTNTIFVNDAGVQESQRIFIDPRTGMQIVASAGARVLEVSGSTAAAAAGVAVYNPGRITSPALPVGMPPASPIGDVSYPRGAISTLGTTTIPPLNDGLFGFPIIPAGPPPVPLPVPDPSPANRSSPIFDDDNDIPDLPKPWPAPLAVAPPGPNVPSSIDAINRFLARGRFAWVHHMNGAQTVRVNGTIEAVGAALEERNTVLGTLWKGGCMIINMCEKPDAGTMHATGTVYGHMVCRLGGYMMEWQPIRREHPEAVSFIVRPVDAEGKCAVDHRGYMDRTLKGLGMKWVEIQYRDGGARQYVAVTLKGRSSPMVEVSSGWNLTVEGGLKKGVPRWPM